MDEPNNLTVYMVDYMQHIYCAACAAPVRDQGHYSSMTETTLDVPSDAKCEGVPQHTGYTGNLCLTAVGLTGEPQHTYDFDGGVKVGIFGYERLFDGTFKLYTAEYDDEAHGCYMPLAGGEFDHFPTRAEVKALLAPLTSRTRQVEVYVGVTYGSSAGPWYTDYVDIPAMTPEDKVEEKARAVFLETYKGEEMVAFVGLYNASHEEATDTDTADAEDADDEHGYEIKCYRTAQDFKGLVCDATFEGFSSMESAKEAAATELETYEVVKAQSYDREEIEIITREGVTLD
jgi:hypothetical protein